MAPRGCSGKDATSWVKSNPLMLATIAAVIVGVALGFSLRSVRLTPDAITWLGIWGELFLRMLKMIILPLIVCSLVVGVASLDGEASGKLGGMTLGYIFCTQLISTAVGAVMVAIIKPGAGFRDSLPERAHVQQTSYTDIFTDLFRNMFPENIVQACLQSAYTSLEPVEPKDLDVNLTLLGNDTSETAIIKKILYRDRMNIMGVVVFGMVLGMAICAVGEAGKPLYKFFYSLNEVIMKIMSAILWYSPIGICSLIASALVKVESMEAVLQSVGLFVATVFAGLCIHQMIILPLIYLLICRKNPFTYMFGMLDAILAGIAPCSSAVAMPYLLRTCPDKFGIDKRVAQFVLPLEITLNRDGSSLFVYCCTLFVAQSYSITLSVGHQLMLILLTTILVAAAAVVPSASIMVVIMVTAAVGLPLEGRLGLLMAVEWITDRLRTGTNIASHGYGCAIIDSLGRKFLRNSLGPAQDVMSDVKDSPLSLSDKPGTGTALSNGELDPLNNVNMILI